MDAYADNPSPGTGTILSLSTKVSFYLAIMVLHRLLYTLPSVCSTTVCVNV